MPEDGLIYLDPTPLENVLSRTRPHHTQTRYRLSCVAPVLYDGAQSWELASPGRVQVEADPTHELSPADIVVKFPHRSFNLPSIPCCDKEPGMELNASFI
ncbi:hypothetical protein RRG08_028708 [Elysia crispata]|uniref:Uncharacterized protein n=1 Tax=Elysia crispata TaxID=231223 RepID=A0AAE1CJA6_9GAST|nr:hypothetical protein RRG08_028708 [Elysia crispata]